MTSDQREIGASFRFYKPAGKIGSVSKTRRYFGIGRTRLYRWRKTDGVDGSRDTWRAALLCFLPLWNSCGFGIADRKALGDVFSQFQ